MENNFQKAFENYINVVLRDSWGYKETYEVKIIDEGILLQNNGSIQLVYILKIPKYKNAFEKTILPGISKIFPSAKEYGLSILPHSFESGSFKILVKKLLYIDLLPNEILPIILVNNPNDIRDIINVSTRNMEGIYNEIIMYKDLILTGGKLFKWIQPRGEKKYYTQKEFEIISKQLDKINNIINYKLNNIFYTVPVNEFWYGKRIIDFLLDTSANFDKINGYPLVYSVYGDYLFIFEDVGLFSLIKMRQFYPHFIGVPHEMRFAKDLYFKMFQFNKPNLKTNEKQIMRYIETGKIEGGLVYGVENLDRMEYIFNNLLYDPTFKFKDLDEYIRILNYIRINNDGLLQEYKNKISKEELNKLIEYARDKSHYKSDQVTLILYVLLIDEKDRIVNNWKAIMKVDEMLNL